MATAHVLYVVVTPEGVPARRASSRSVKAYESLAWAQRATRTDEAVVEVTLDLSKEPVFIRQRRVRTKKA